MKALILAAGLGSRLKHKTADRPKAMTAIGKKTIVEYQIDALLRADISQIGIVLGYKGNMLKQFLKDQYPTLRFHFFRNEIYDKSNSSYSFWVARTFVSGISYLHLNCDIVFSDDLLSKILNAPYDNSIAVRTDVPLGDEMENVALDNANRITKMEIRHFREAVGKAFGMAKLSAQSSQEIEMLLHPYISSGDLTQNYYGQIRRLVSTVPYYAEVSDQNNLLEVNTLTDFEQATQLLNGSFNLLKKDSHASNK